MKKILFLLLTGLTVTLWSQKLNVKIRVFEAGKPVSDAIVQVENLHLSAQTGQDGTAQFRLPAGVYVFSAHKDQKSATVKVAVKSDMEIKLILTGTEQLETVEIRAIRANSNTPVSASNISKPEIEKKYLAQDIPYLMNDLPSVVSTSDAGHGVGYTGIRIRGISPQQINVTLNGIPLNDPESHSVYWVDIPDFISNTESIQVQRGVGTSTYGTGAFGANIHLETEKASDSAYFYTALAYGSFNTRRLTAKAATGKFNRFFSLTGRFSKIKSDGYIDRAFADMNSYYLSAMFDNGLHKINFIHFGGHERTYQAWYGVDKQTFEENPTFNYAGAIYDNNWNIIGFYDNEVDDYTQKHYQLHYTFSPSKSLQINTNLFYINGYGYYEQYKQDQAFSKYGITPFEIGGQTIDHTDLIRRKWLDNDFFGTNINLLLKNSQMNWVFGMGLNRYLGAHFGRVIWARFAGDSEIRHTYYRNLGDKRSMNFFVKNQYQITPELNLYSDIQIRSIYYNIHFNPEITFDQDERIQLTDKLFFINPKIGIYYHFAPRKSFYLSLAQTHREPNRTDYKENPVKPQPETLHDLESGLKIQSGNWLWKTNIYLMYYKNQLVYTGRIDEVGNPIRENVGKSYRTGWENEIRFNHNPMEIKAYFTISQNKNIDYKAWDGNTLKNYGKTDIAFSPAFTGGFLMTYTPLKNTAITFRYKYIGKQYMDNRNIPESVLPAYGTAGLDFHYSLPHPRLADQISFTCQINNLFNKKYASNGYMWGDSPYYFPQAGRHFFAGIKILF